MTVSLPPEIVEQRSDEREVFALINALRRQIVGIGGGAPVDASYWVSTADATLTAEVNLGALSSGILQHAVVAGVSTPSVLTMAATSVLGTSFAAGAPADISATFNGDVLRLSGGILGFGTLGAASVPALDAHFWTDRSEATLANEVNLGALSTGVLQHTVTAGVSAPSAFSVGANLIPFGVAAGTGLLATQSTFGYNDGTQTLFVGLAAGSVGPAQRLWLRGNSASGNDIRLENQNAGVNAYSGMFFENNAAHTGFIYFTSSNYTGSDAPPSSFALYTGPTAGSVLLSPKGVQTLVADGTDIALPRAGGQTITKTVSGNLTFQNAVGDIVLNATIIGLNLPGGQVLDKGGAGTFYIGTRGAQDIEFYTNFGTTKLKVAAGGDVSVTNLNAGGVVYATAATGVLKIGTSAEVAGAITWPTAPRVLFSSGTTTAPTGVAGFEYDTGDDQFWLGSGKEQAWYNLGATGPNATDFERVRAFWTGNVWNLTSEKAGTGTVRGMKFDADTATLELETSGTITVDSGRFDITAATASQSNTITGNSTSSLSIQTWNAIGLTTAGTTPSINLGTSEAGITIATAANAIDLNSAPTIASAGAATLDAIRFRGNATITGTTTITVPFALVSVAQVTFSQSGAGTVTVDNPVSLYVAAQPLAGTDVTFTQAYAFWVDQGLARFDGNGTHVFEVPADATAGADVTIDGRIPIRVGGATKYIRYYAD